MMWLSAGPAPSYSPREFYDVKQKFNPVDPLLSRTSVDYFFPGGDSRQTVGPGPPGQPNTTLTNRAGSMAAIWQARSCIAR
jgi:hypothetical protein